MKTLIKYAFVVCLLCNYAIAQQPISRDALMGTWLVQDGSAKVKIEKTNGKYAGKMVWIKNPNDKTGKPLLDAKNPEASLRSRPQLGLPLLENFVFDEENLWKDGTIYNPDDGKTYSCKISMKNYETIEVRGYVGIAIFGRTETWKRTSDITMK